MISISVVPDRQARKFLKWSIISLMKGGLRYDNTEISSRSRLKVKVMISGSVLRKRHRQRQWAGNVAEQKVYKAVQWLCACALIPGKFLCRPLQ